MLRVRPEVTQFKEWFRVTITQNYLNLLSRVDDYKRCLGAGNWNFSTLTFVTTNNYDSLTEIRTPKITEAPAHINSSYSSIAVAW